MKKLLALLLALVLVLSMAACDSFGGGSDTDEDDDEDNGTSVNLNSAEGVAKAYVLATVGGDADKFLDVTPKMMWDAYAEECDLDEDYSRKDLLKELEAQISAEDKVKVKVTDAEESDDYDEDDIEEAIERIADVYEFDTDDIDDAKVISVEYKVTLDGESAGASANVICVEIDGDWYAIGNP